MKVYSTDSARRVIRQQKQPVTDLRKVMLAYKLVKWRRSHQFLARQIQPNFQSKENSL